jgi:hypothetical protein
VIQRTDTLRPRTSSNTSLRGHEANALRKLFPPRSVPDTWPASAATHDEILERVDRTFVTAVNGTRRNRIRGAEKLLRWLATFSGDSWQQRWCASPAHNLRQQWHAAPQNWLCETAINTTNDLQSGLLALLCEDVIRPHVSWVVGHRSRLWASAIATYRDPDGFAALTSSLTPDQRSRQHIKTAFGQIARIVIAKGGGVRDVTVGDCLEFRELYAAAQTRSRGKILFYSLLRGIGTFPADAPTTLNRLTGRSGQVSVGQLVDQYAVQHQPVRNLLVDYLTERQPALDYTTLKSLARILANTFWKDLEQYNPGIDSLALGTTQAAAWKDRLRTKTTHHRRADGSIDKVTTTRRSYQAVLTTVRAFYLDLAQWAAEDPARWGPWSLPCPISAAEVSNWHKEAARRKAATDHRTRERLPILPMLVDAAAQRLQDTRTRLNAVRAAAPGQPFSVSGSTFIKASHGAETTCVYDLAGRRHDMALVEHRAFWAWAAIEFLRHTGVRIEEMLEVNHHSLIQYRLPTTGELIPLLQIAPSKSDQERLLPVD